MALSLLCIVMGAAVLVAPYVPRNSSLVRKLLIACSFALIARYLIWRVVKLPELELAFYPLCVLAFFALESLATYLALDDFLLLKVTNNRSPEVDRHLDWHLTKPPRVDILIATYNEPWEVLEKTIVGAQSQNYPTYHVWVLDDGNRPWLRERAAACNVGYVTRSDNTHYKAGNLNHGIAELRALGIELEFLALLDADFIARPDFVRRTMALMATPDIGIVQTPQCFYNPDPHQLAFGVENWPDEQRGWFDVYLPALDARGWASCCGTSCLIRVAALDAIGGFPTASVCEDTLSSIKMRRVGWKTAFLHEPLTVGLAPEGIGEFLTQRARWMLGGVQNTRYCGSGPGIRARVRYWLSLWRSAIWGVMPPIWVGLCILFWFTGISLIPISDFDEVLSYFGPLWVIRICQGWLFAGRQQPFVSDAIWMLLSPLWVEETFRAIIGSKARFKVTDKALHRDKSLVHWRLLPFHGTLVVLLLSGLVYNLIDPAAPAYNDGFFQANTALSIWFTLVILAGIAPMIEPPKRRMANRYPSLETITAFANGQRMLWRCRDISLGGVLVHTDGCETIPESVQLELSGVSGVQAKLVRSPAPGCAAFEFQTPEARPDLIRKLYCTESYIPSPAQWSLVNAGRAFFKQLLF